MRVKGGKGPRKSKVRVFKEAEGFWGGRRKLWKTVMQVVRRAKHVAFVGRKQKKRDMRRLWIERINAAARMNGMSYSKLVGALKKKNIEIDRKSLADVAVRDPKGFAKIVETAKA
jgi:large subunit ribosomal protein L20